MRERFIDKVELVVVVGQLQDAAVDLSCFHDVLLSFLLPYFLLHDLTRLVLQLVQAFESALQ